MSATCVPAVRTNFTIPEFVKALSIAWKSIYNIYPDKRQIAVIFAQWSIETGQGKSCWNFNIGNVKFVPSSNPTDDDGKQYMMLKGVWEIIGGKKVIFEPPHQATWFRAFSSIDEGVAHHIDFLKNKRYKKAWAAVEKGSPIEFAHLLKEAKYYTAPEADYAKAVGLYFNKFMKDDTFEKIIAELVAPEPAVQIETVPETKNEAETIVVVPEPTPSKFEETLPSNVESPTIVQNPIPPVTFWQSIINMFSNLFKK